MAADANVIAGGERYRIRTAEERRRAFASATRHTKFVNFLRKALPIFAVLVLATYFISTRLATSISIGDMNASIEGFEVKDGNLRMVNPKLEGADKKNGKYVIGADYADQDIKNPNLIKLHAIKADLAAIDGGWSRMTAVRGRFDNKTGRLVMHNIIPRLSDTPGRLRLPAPALGEHTAEILGQLGIDATTLDRLAADGVIGLAPHPDPLPAGGERA